MITYIITNEDSTKKDDIIKSLSKRIGVNSATNLVNHWFDNYDNFIYSNESGTILAYKSRVHGDWSIVAENLQAFRMQ